MSYLLSFIQQNELKQADAMVLRKKFMGMVDHFAIFLGYDTYGDPFVVANYKDGVKRVESHDLENFIQTLEPTRIERFIGSEYERQEAVRRAISRIGEKAYDYFSNNCESFKNWVQKGINYSLQAENFNKLMGHIAIGGMALTLITLAFKKPKYAIWVFAFVLLAFIAWILSRNNDIEN
jgi:hypothetical protein